MREVYAVVAWEHGEAPQMHGVFTDKDAAIEHGERIAAEQGHSWFFVEVHGVRVDEPHQPDATPAWES